MNFYMVVIEVGIKQYHMYIDLEWFLLAGNVCNSFSRRGCSRELSSEKTEIFYTCNALVTKVKQLQRVYNLICFWFLETC